MLVNIILPEKPPTIRKIGSSGSEKKHPKLTSLSCQILPILEEATLRQPLREDSPTLAHRPAASGQPKPSEESSQAFPSPHSFY